MYIYILFSVDHCLFTCCGAAHHAMCCGLYNYCRVRCLCDERLVHKGIDMCVYINSHTYIIQILSQHSLEDHDMREIRVTLSVHVHL